MEFHFGKMKESRWLMVMVGQQCECINGLKMVKMVNFNTKDISVTTGKSWMGSEVIVMKGYEFPHYDGCAMAIRNILCWWEIYGSVWEGQGIPSAVCTHMIQGEKKSFCVVLTPFSLCFRLFPKKF